MCHLTYFPLFCSLSLQNFSAMKIPHEMAMLPLAIIYSLAFIFHGIPYEGSVLDALALLGRDNTANYVVCPKDTTNAGQATAINTLLKGVVSDPTTIYASTTDKGTLFWGVPLTSANAKTVGANSNVRICSRSWSKNSRTDDHRSLQSFRNANPIAAIQQLLTTQAPLN